MNGSETEVRQIALHALDGATAKETLQRTYPGIIVSTIRIVEASCKGRKGNADDR